MLAIIGISGMVIGLLLVITGSYMAWRAEKKADDQLRGSAEFVDSLARLMDSLAKHPLGIRLLVLGIVLFFVGGIVSAGDALSAML
ncbi:hypothetical protein ACIHFD_59895 [Nonomuraea sp. NPDC051941]|uniref:hypothetical protein n=1 Tax=Nonomuraea sp. NPDC051941 TaxID=3364373 RepID=UPI0037C6110B